MVNHLLCLVRKTASLCRFCRCERLVRATLKLQIQTRTRAQRKSWRSVFQARPSNERAVRRWTERKRLSLRHPESFGWAGMGWRIRRWPWRTHRWGIDESAFTDSWPLSNVISPHGCGSCMRIFGGNESHNYHWQIWIRCYGEAWTGSFLRIDTDSIVNMLEHCSWSCSHFLRLLRLLRRRWLSPVGAWSCKSEGQRVCCVHTICKGMPWKGLKKKNVNQRTALTVSVESLSYGHLYVKCDLDHRSLDLLYSTQHGDGLIWLTWHKRNWRWKDFFRNSNRALNNVLCY